MAKAFTLEEVLEKIEIKNPGKFEITEDLSNYKYKNVHQKIKVKCKICGYEYKEGKRINDLLHGYGCCNCAGIPRYNIDDMKKRVHELDSEYDLISENSKTRDYGKFIHYKCGETFQMKIHNFVTLGERCPICNSSIGTTNSKGIQRIKKYLESKDIKYEQEKKFGACVFNGYHLPFDIYLIDLNILIEFDGIQHFKPVEIFGGEERFKRCQENDKFKNKFAEENNIKLIRISYKEIDSIENILENNI